MCIKENFYGSSWCVYSKEHGVCLKRRTPKTGFCFIPKFKQIMETKINLVPLADWLAIEGYSASEMAVFFDELEHDYARTVIALQVADLTPRNALHEKTDNFLYLLRELREVFRQC